MTDPGSVVIVGGSLAGVRCAGALRRGDYGGPITVVGAESHAAYDRPPLSKQYLSGDWDRNRLLLLPEEQRADLRVEWLLGTTAVALDAEARTVILDDGAEVAGDAIVLATGARPRTLPGADDIVGVHVLRTIDHATALRSELAGGRRRLVVVGAGFIGAEVAATASAAGHEVTIIEAASVPLRRGLGDHVGAICGSLHADHGVELRLDTTVESVEIDARGRVEGVRLDDGDALEADLVLVGIGVVPNTEWLDGSGLAVDDGIVCNEFCEAAPGIYAAGDVARWHHRLFDEAVRVEHWENAVDQGTYVAGRMTGQTDEPFAPVPWFWSDQYGHKLQLAGHPAADDRVEVVTGSVAERRFAAIYGRGDRLTGVFGLNRPRQVMQYRRLIAEGVSFPDALGLTEEDHQP